MQRLIKVTLLDVSEVAGHHAMPAALLFNFSKVNMQTVEMTDNISEVRLRRNQLFKNITQTNTCIQNNVDNCKYQYI